MSRITLNGRELPTFDFIQCRTCAKQFGSECMPPDDGTACPERVELVKEQGHN
jgi:hypothetical protein